MLTLDELINKNKTYFTNITPATNTSQKRNDRLELIIKGTDNRYMFIINGEDAIKSGVLTKENDDQYYTHVPGHHTKDEVWNSKLKDYLFDLVKFQKIYVKVNENSLEKVVENLKNIYTKEINELSEKDIRRNDLKASLNLLSYINERNLEK